MFLMKNRAFGPFFAVENNFFCRKIFFTFCQIFLKTFDDYFKQKEVKYDCLARQKRLQVWMWAKRCEDDFYTLHHQFAEANQPPEDQVNMCTATDNICFCICDFLLKTFCSVILLWFVMLHASTCELIIAGFYCE